MAILATNESVERELIAEGTHVAICFSMIDLGTKENEFEGKVKKQHKARLEWELCNETFTYEKDGEEITGLYRIGKDYTLSMHEKANLRKDLQSWRGKAFSEKEAKSFDVTVLLGKPCLIGVVHETSTKGKKYAKISSISTLVKGMEVPKQLNESFLFELDNYTDEKFNLLPEWLQEQISESDEYKQIKGLSESQQASAQPDSVDVSSEESDDSLPF